MASKRAVKAGNAFIQFSLRDGKVKKQLRALQKRLLALGAGLQRIGAIGAKVGIGIAAGLAFPVKAASDLQETMGKFNTVFGSNASQVKKWSDTFAGEVGRSKTQVASFLASMQDLFVPMGFASAEAEGLSKQVTRLAVDLASFNNKTDAEVIRDLQAALTGSGETMKKYGVIVSQAAVNQSLLNQGLDPRNATEMQKTHARLNIIMAGTTAAQGDAIRTGDSFANQLKRAGGVATDLAAAVGGPLLSPLASLLGYFSDLAKSAAAGAGGMYQSIREFLGRAAEEASVRLAAMWEVSKEVWGAIHSIVSTVWESISGIVYAAMDWIDKVLTTGLSAIAFAFKNWRVLLEAAVNTALLSVVRFSNQTVHFFGEVVPKWLMWFYNNWHDIFSDIATMTKTIAVNIWQNLKNMWDAIAGLFNGEGFHFEWTPLTEGFKSAIKEMPKIAAREMGPVEAELQKRMDALGEELVQNWEANNRKIIGNAASFTDFAMDTLGLSGADTSGETAKKVVKAMSGVADEVANASAAGGGVDSRGTFSVSAIAAGLLRGGGDSYAQRTAKAAEETAKSAKATAKNTAELKKNKTLMGA